VEPKITWFAQSAFRVEHGGKLIYLDPFQVPDGEPTADVILLTHDHFDHLSAEDLAKVRGEDTVVITGPAVSAKIEGPFTELAPGESTSIDSLNVRAVPAYTTTKLRDSGEPTHPKESQHVGYVFEIDDLSFYFLGDTDVIPEMNDIGPVDYAFIPVSGVFVMTAEEAAEAAAIIQPSVAIPCHFGHVVGSVDDARRFADLVPDQVRVWIMEPLSKNE
jgi:L-ascorbate metabolism protein UlaG (beta-lactamase superfamily)